MCHERFWSCVKQHQLSVLIFTDLPEQSEYEGPEMVDGVKRHYLISSIIGLRSFTMRLRDTHVHEKVYS